MKWDESSLRELSECYQQGYSIPDLALKFNVTTYAIKAILYRKNETRQLRKRAPYVKWDENLEQKIASMLQNSLSLYDIAKSMNISYSSLTSKMRRLNLRFEEQTENVLTPKDVITILDIAESQFRQVLNNRSIECYTRGKQLIISKKSLEEWLSNGNSMLYTPREENGEWMEIWKKSLARSFKRITTMSEVSSTFQRSKMAISYYGKKKNFPKVFAYLNSYNVYHRNDVNAWALKHNYPILPLVMEDNFFYEFANEPVIDLYKKFKEEIDEIRYAIELT